MRALMLLAIFSSILVSAITAAGEDSIAARVAAQRRARDMARELVTTVIDGQLRRLEENGLEGEPIHTEIEALRNEIDHIVQESMTRVIEQLAAAERATGPRRQQKYAAAREATRNVVFRLSAARQAVLRRIRSAELLGQVDRLRALQRHAHAATQSLSKLPAERRADRAVELLADQRDISTLFSRLSESLNDVATWDGQIAISATAARRWIANAGVNKELRHAEAALRRADYAGAIAGQAVLVARFEELWKRLDASARGREQGGGRLLDRVQQLLARQQTLRDEVAAAGEAVPTPLPLVKGQQSLAGELVQLGDFFQGDPILMPLQEQASGAARAATEALFIAKVAKGVAEQERVIDRLQKLAELIASESATPRDRSAAEFAQAIAQLEQVRSALAEIITANKGLEAGEKAALADRLEQLTNHLPDAPAIAARLENAAQAMRDDNNAQAALEQAQASIEERLADWKRAEIAVRIGELARAAEALERAAAAERSLAQSVRDERGRGGEGERGRKGEERSVGEDRANWNAVHEDVMAVARASRKGVRSAAPEAARQLDESIALGEKVKQAIGDQQHSNPKLADQAVRLSQSLSGAAATLREVIGKSASELAGVAETQMIPVAQAREAVRAAAGAVDSDHPTNLTELAREAARRAALADFASTVAAQAAEQAATASNMRDATAALERTGIRLTAREQELEQARRLSAQLGEFADRQQHAADAIHRSREALVDAPRDAAEMSQAQQEAARTMRSATERFAATQQATGEAAARISKQRQLANAAILEALKAAGRLPVPQPPPGEPSETATAQTGPAGETSSGESSESTPSAEQQAAATQDDTMKTASSGAPGQNQAGASGAASNSSGTARAGSQAIGTELVPAAPHETARMMAGAQAQAAMEAMAAMAAATSDDIAASNTGMDLPDGAGDREGQGGTKGDAETDGANPSMTSTEGAPPAEGASPPGVRREDASMSQNDAGGTGWFAKLPPDVRAAIQANSTQPAPRGYEQRLKQYFESVE